MPGAVPHRVPVCDADHAERLVERGSVGVGEPAEQRIAIEERQATQPGRHWRRDTVVLQVVGRYVATPAQAARDLDLVEL